jgi:hypothetical protein
MCTKYCLEILISSLWVKWNLIVALRPKQNYLPSKTFYRNKVSLSNIQRIYINMCVLSRVWVTMDGFWFDDRIHWTVWYSAWLRFTVHCCTHQCLQSRLHWRYLLAASNGGRTPSSGYPSSPRLQLPASHSNSSQRLNRGSYLTHSLPH